MKYTDKKTTPIFTCINNIVCQMKIITSLPKLFIYNRARQSYH